jgi:hypothetical protein
MNRPRTSRQHYDVFRRDYKQGTLDDKTAAAEKQPADLKRASKRPRLPEGLSTLALPTSLGRCRGLRAPIAAAGFDMIRLDGLSIEQWRAAKRAGEPLQGRVSGS